MINYSALIELLVDVYDMGSSDEYCYLTGKVRERKDPAEISDNLNYLIKEYEDELCAKTH